MLVRFDDVSITAPCCNPGKVITFPTKSFVLKTRCSFPNLSFHIMHMKRNFDTMYVHFCIVPLKGATLYFFEDSSWWSEILNWETQGKSNSEGHTFPKREFVQGAFSLHIRLKGNCYLLFRKAYQWLTRISQLGTAEKGNVDGHTHEENLWHDVCPFLHNYFERNSHLILNKLPTTNSQLWSSRKRV